MRALLAIALTCAVATSAAADTTSPSSEEVRRAFDIARAIARGGCASTVRGRPFRGAETLCLAFAGEAVTAAALDEPARATAAAAVLDRLIDRALSAQRDFAGTGTRIVAGKRIASSVLYRGLLGVLLAGRERIAALSGPATAMPAATARLADALADSLARDLATGYLASYPGGIWPCDHAPVAAFLRAHATSNGDASAADALEDRLAQLLAVGFATKVDRRGRAIDADERTTALAFTAAFLLPARPVLAGLFAERAVARCERALGAACHEWNPRDGRVHRDDAASGPTIEGFSTGATGLALVAARARRDPALADALLGTAMLLGADKLPVRSLEAALVAWAGVARPW